MATSEGSNKNPYVQRAVRDEDPFYGSMELSKTAASGVSSDIVIEEEADFNNEVAQYTKPKAFAFLKTKRFWIILVLGQLLSLSIVATNTFTTYLTDDGNNIPAFQTFFNYVILCLIFTSYTIYRYGFRKYAKMMFHDCWKYFILAFADVEGNYFVVKAYQYTNLLSAELLDNWTIAVVVVLSFLFLKVRYHWTQYAGIIICIAGMVLVVIGDLVTDKNYPAVDMVKGDLFVILGATCYGVSNTLEEFLVSERPIYEVLGQMGLFGMVINGVQASIFERDSIRDAHWGSSMAGWFTGYTLCLLFLYMTAPILFRMSSAAFYNLSLLTSDFWGFIIGIKVFAYRVYWLYPVGFVFTISGMVIYNAFYRTLDGEARKPWIGEDQKNAITGIGTVKNKPADEEN
ncbi:hypothetical protein V1511DRAFT_454825 [Dipodascopsis uninucleata]